MYLYNKLLGNIFYEEKNRSSIFESFFLQETKNLCKFNEDEAKLSIEF